MRGKRPVFQGNKDQILRGTNTILGNTEHKTNFGGTGEQDNLFQGNKRTGAPSEGLSYLCGITLFHLIIIRHIEESLSESIRQPQ